MIVMKFGGTSVGLPERMHSIAKLINSSERKIVVLSAVSGTTNTLVDISNKLFGGEKEKAIQITDELHKKYTVFVENLYSSNTFKEKSKELIKEHFKFIKSFTKDLFTVYEERAILAQGELLSTALFQLYLEESNVSSKLLPALEFMRLTTDNEPDKQYIEQHLNAILSENENCNLFITQGYICRNSFGEIDNLKRGGSDYSASLIGAACNATEIQIWTDIDGMHNNDPRIVNKTYPIRELSFDEAAELAYFGAKILHPSSILPAREKNIPVRLLNTMQPDASGTLISKETKGSDIKAVAAKDDITVIKIRSSRMLLAYGFLRSVFEVFERFKTPIDMITTSEVSVSLTIDNTTNLEKIITELTSFGHVEYESNQTIICIVGDGLADKKGLALTVFSALKTIPIRMISYGGSKNNVSILINSEHKNEALNAINKDIFKIES